MYDFSESERGKLKKYKNMRIKELLELKAEKTTETKLLLYFGYSFCFLEPVSCYYDTILSFVSVVFSAFNSSNSLILMFLYFFNFPLSDFKRESTTIHFGIWAVEIIMFRP
jgi:hypothetical protein